MDEYDPSMIATPESDDYGTSADEYVRDLQRQCVMLASGDSGITFTNNGMGPSNSLSPIQEQKLKKFDDGFNDYNTQDSNVNIVS